MNIQSKLPYQRRLYRTFLSHAHADKAFVDQLHRWLSKIAAVPTWYDTSNLSTSATISTELANAIAQCQSMILVLSKASIKSGWVEEEYNAAIGQRAKYKRYRIIPICIDDCEIPGFLQTTKWIEIPDKKFDARSALELITGLYYDDKALSLDNVWDIYISRSWQPAESSMPDYVCQMLNEVGFRLIGDTEDQSDYKPERVHALIKSCGGLVAILPDRGQGSTSKYILDEIAFAYEAGLHCLIIAEPEVILPDRFAHFVLPLTYKNMQTAQSTQTIQSAIEVLGEKWHRPASPHYVFLATNLDVEWEQKNLLVKQAIEHITAMPCIVGDKVSGSHLRETIIERIQQSFMVVADISEKNINTCIEAGIAVGSDKHLNLISHGIRGNVPFMLSNYQVFNYEDDLDLLGIVHRIAYSFRRRVLNNELPR